MGEIGRWPHARRLGVDDLEQRVETAEAAIETLEAEVAAIESADRTAVYDTNVASGLTIPMTIPSDASLVRWFASSGGPYLIQRGTVTGWSRGNRVRLHLASSAIQLGHLSGAGTGAQFVLDGGASVTGPALLEVMYDGTYWREVPSRGTAV